MEYGFAKAPIKTASATGTTVTADIIIVAVCRAERATVYQIRWCELRFSFSEAEIGNFALVSAAASEEQANSSRLVPYFCWALTVVPSSTCPPPFCRSLSVKG